MKMDTDMENLEDFIPTVIYAWEENDEKVLKRILAIIKNIISPLSELKQYKKWFRKSQTNWKNEERALCDDILGAYYQHIKKLPQQEKKTSFESLKIIAADYLKHRLQEYKSQEKFEDKRNISFRTSESETDERPAFSAKNNPSDNTVYLKTEEFLRDAVAEKHAADLFKKLAVCFDETNTKIKKELGKSFDKDLDALLKQLIKSDLKRQTKHAREGKSVFILAQENDIKDYRKLLYTLKEQIHFPLINTKENRKGRIGNYVSEANLPLFEKILPQIKWIWKREQTKKDWIQYFKKEHGWGKTRISKFMSRKTQKGSVPPAFFEVFPLSRELFSQLTKSDDSFKKLFEGTRQLKTKEEINLSDIYGEKGTYKYDLKTLKELFTKRKTLLTE